MDKKERIVQAAIAVFQEKGIEKTKVADIVKLAGIAQGTFYLYFPSKLSVMPAIAEVLVERELSAVQQAVDEKAPLPTRLTQVVDAIFQFTRDYRELLALVYAGLASSEHIKEWESVYDPLYKAISGIFQEAKQDGLIRDSIQADRAAKLFIGLIESAAEQVYLYDNTDEAEAVRQKEAVMDFLKHGFNVTN